MNEFTRDNRNDTTRDDDRFAIDAWLGEGGHPGKDD